MAGDAVYQTLERTDADYHTLREAPYLQNRARFDKNPCPTDEVLLKRIQRNYRQFQGDGANDLAHKRIRTHLEGCRRGIGACYTSAGVLKTLASPINETEPLPESSPATSQRHLRQSVRHTQNSNGTGRAIRERLPDDLVCGLENDSRWSIWTITRSRDHIND